MLPVVANVDDATNFDCDDSPVGSGAYFVDDLPLVAVIAIFAISFGINGLAHAILLASYAIGFQVNTDSGPNSIESSCPGTYIQVEDVVPPELAAQDQTEFADNLSSREISPDFSQSSMATLVPDRTEPQLARHLIYYDRTSQLTISTDSRRTSSYTFNSV